MAVQVKISANGRICIPADVRVRLGIRDGDTLLLEEEEHGLVLRTTDQGVRKAQAIYQRLLNGRQGMSVDEFIAERHRQAEREEAEHRERYG